MLSMIGCCWQPNVIKLSGMDAFNARMLLEPHVLKLAGIAFNDRMLLGTER